jgi:hypothetical protein
MFLCGYNLTTLLFFKPHRVIDFVFKVLTLFYVSMWLQFNHFAIFKPDRDIGFIFKVLTLFYVSMWLQFNHFTIF